MTLAPGEIPARQHAGHFFRSSQVWYPGHTSRLSLVGRRTAARLNVRIVESGPCICLNLRTGLDSLRRSNSLEFAAS